MHTFVMISAISALVLTVALLSREAQRHGYTMIVVGAGVPLATQANTAGASAPDRFSKVSNLQPLAQGSGNTEP